MRASLSRPCLPHIGSLFSPHGCTAGLAMVELLIAMGVGLFLVGGILQVMVSSKASYRLGEAEARVQENGRFAVQMLASDMRGARSTGCASIKRLETSSEPKREDLGDYETVPVKAYEVLACQLLDPDLSEAPDEEFSACQGTPVIRSEHPLGYSASQAAAGEYLSELPGTADAGAQATVARQWLRGDILVSWGATGSGMLTKVPSSQPTGKSPIELLSPEKELTGGRLALITDCTQAHIFAITNPDSCQKTTTSSSGALEHDEYHDPDRTPEDCGEDATVGYTDKSAARANSTPLLSPVRPYNSVGETIRATVFPFQYSVYYVCCTDAKEGSIQQEGSVNKCNTNPNRFRPALCRWSTSTNGTAQQFVSDVADMRVIYDGYVNGKGGERFLDLSEVVPDAAWVSAQGFWDRVDSARIQLLATTAEEVRTEAAVPNPNAEKASDLGLGLPADRRIYQSFDVTTAIRANVLWYVQR